MELWHLITNGHANIAGLCGDILRAVPGRHARSRDRLFDELEGDLRRHIEAEEDSLYDALEDHDRTEQLIAELEDEHEEIERLLDRLARSSDTGSRAWTLQFRTLAGLIEGHFHREEQELLPAARAILSPEELRELRHEFVEEKLEELRKARRGGWTSLAAYVLVGALAGMGAGALAFAARRSGTSSALGANSFLRRLPRHATAEQRSRTERAERLPNPTSR